MSIKTIKHTILALATLVLLSACFLENDNDPIPINPPPPPPPPPPTPTYQAEIIRTEFNVAHITADSFGSIGFGQGYSAAQDGVCVLADQFVKLRSERAKYLGAGPNNAFIASDIGYLAIDYVGRASEAFETLSDVSQQLITGYAAGYNQFLEDTGIDNLPVECAGQEWVTSITPEFLFAYHLDVAASLTSSQFTGFIAAAAPPSASSSSVNLEAPEQLPDLSNPSFGSNMLALGSERTEHGKGMLLANPHLPWFGQFTYTEQHLIIPGELNVSGVQILGIPMLGIGFNEFAAQSVTVSQTTQYTAYQLTLSDDSDLAYVYDDEVRQIDSQLHSIEVLQEDGSLVTIEQSTYSSHYGPMLVIPFVGEWTSVSAISARFPDYVGIIDSYIQTLLMKTNEEFKELMFNTGGSPFLNYSRSTQEGDVYYIDASPVPNLQPDAIQSYFVGLATNPIANALLQSGIVLLDGSDSLFEWNEDVSSPTPGIIPPSFAPQYEGNDYVVHNNDNAWIVNEATRIDLPSPLYGQQGAPRSPRNRTAFKMINDEPGRNSLFSQNELEALQFSNRSGLAEMIKDDLAQHCLIDPTFDLDGTLVDLTEACTLLANWDGTFNLDSVGAPVFREFISNYTTEQLTSGDGFFAVPYDPLEPTTTPNTLLISTGPRSEDPLLRNLAIATQRLSSLSTALDAPYSEWQFTLRGGERIALPGAGGLPEGAWNLVGYDTGLLNASTVHRAPTAELVNPVNGLTADGYLVTTGPSYIMTVSYENGAPSAKALLTYGQSRDPLSVHHDDQVPLFANGQLRDVYFSPEDVAENAVSEITVEAFLD